MSEPKHASCCQLGETLGISHDSANRFLLREHYEPSDLYAEALRVVKPVGGTLSVDDTVLDKPYASKMAYVGYFWSGKHHKTVKGINLITLYYADNQGQRAPVNYRLYDKTEGKTKNDYFLEMLAEVLAWGLKPAYVTADSWYACISNLKTVKEHGMAWLMAIESNRIVSVEKGCWTQVQQLDIPPEGRIVWLKAFGQVKLFRTTLKDQMRHYLTYLPKEDDYDSFQREHFQHLHDQHWQIEQYHRVIKQVCNIERFQVRTHTAITNHIFAALCSFVQLQRMTATDLISNAYCWKRELYREIVANFTKDFALSLPHLNTQFIGCVNA